MSKAKPEIGKTKVPKKKTKKNSNLEMEQEDLGEDTNIIIGDDDSAMDMDIDLNEIHKPSEVSFIPK